ncbi:MAG: hypothetical protein K1X53_17855 [Candidatus Sumerlaeaceae bacterium]|nr:hypothetical protein [Candidatus Sumerlaeaceae bacterium]
MVRPHFHYAAGAAPTILRVRSAAPVLLQLLLGWLVGGGAALAQTNGLPAVGAQSASSQTSVTVQSQVDVLRSQMNGAIARVQQIVNQPVRQFRIGPGMEWSTYNEGWYHPGANKPDFNNVDIRTTQEKPYDSKGYVSSPLNPGVLFYGPDLEFNPNTKYFITNRNFPRKKLTEAEMVEINSLYRVIGKCEAELNRLRATPTPRPPEPAREEAENSSAPATTSSGGIDPKTGHLMVAGLLVILCVVVVRRLSR